MLKPQCLLQYLHTLAHLPRRSFNSCSLWGLYERSSSMITPRTFVCVTHLMSLLPNLKLDGICDLSPSAVLKHIISVLFMSQLMFKRHFFDHLFKSSSTCFMIEMHVAVSAAETFMVPSSANLRMLILGNIGII